jgi:hypothetical protein
MWIVAWETEIDMGEHHYDTEYEAATFYDSFHYLLKRRKDLDGKDYMIMMFEEKGNGNET